MSTDKPVYQEYRWVDDPDFQDWLNELMADAGDEWDTDEAMTEIARRYVKDLQQRLSGYQGLLDRIWEAFAMMPYLNEAIPGNAHDVRDEVNTALDSFWGDLQEALGRAQRR